MSAVVFLRPLAARVALAAVVTAAALGALVPAASADTGSSPRTSGSSPAPVPLQVTLSGPLHDVPGATSTWSLGLRNQGADAAPAIRVELVLPADVELVSAGRTSSWTCVLGPLSCSLPAGLAAGAAAEPVPLRLRYAPDATGARQLGAIAYQGEDATDGLLLQRGTATVVLAAAPDATATDTSTATSTDTAALSAVPSASSPATPTRPTARALAATVVPARRTATAHTTSTGSTAAGSAGAVTAAEEPASSPAVTVSATVTATPSPTAPAELAFADTAASAPAARLAAAGDDGPSPLLWLTEALLLLGAAIAAGIVVHDRTSRRAG